MKTLTNTASEIVRPKKWENVERSKECRKECRMEQMHSIDSVVGTWRHAVGNVFCRSWAHSPGI
jgi:hypothetical protein